VDIFGGEEPEVFKGPRPAVAPGGISAVSCDFRKPWGDRNHPSIGVI